MSTRIFVVFCLLITVWLSTGLAEAQQPKKVPRIGYLAIGAAGGGPGVEAFREGLRELGYVEGKNIIIEYRYKIGDITEGGIGSAVSLTWSAQPC